MISMDMFGRRKVLTRSQTLDQMVVELAGERPARVTPFVTVWAAEIELGWPRLDDGRE